MERQVRAVRRTVGPILTTGVALTAAGVVVANPIIAPHSDVQIPAVQLSAGTGDAIGMLDQAFLDAIAPAPPESTNPFSVLKQLITSLAADASDASKTAIINAFVAGITAVSEPELTAATVPYVAPPADPGQLAMSVLPSIDISSIIPATGTMPSLPNLTSVVTGSVAPAVTSFVSGLIHDAGYVGGELVAAAFAAGAVVANEPALIGDTLKALVRGDFTGALQSAVKAITAPFGPPVIILNAVATIIEKRLVDVSAGLPSVPVPTSAGVSTDVARTPAPEPVELPTRAPRDEVAVLPVVSGADVPQPAAALGVLDARSDAAGTSDVPEAVDAADATGGDTPAAPRGTVRSVREAVEAAGEQIGSVVTATAEAAGKVTARARGGKPATSG